MSRFNRVSSLFVLIAFLFNTFLVDLSFAQDFSPAKNSATLALAAKTGTILGNVPHDTFVISAWFKEFTALIEKKGFEVDIKTIKDSNILPDSEFKDPEGFSTYRHEARDFGNGIIKIKARKDDKTLYIIEYTKATKDIRVYLANPDEDIRSHSGILKPTSVLEAAGNIGWLAPEEATPMLDALPNIGSIVKLKSLSAEAEKTGLSYKEFLEKFRLELAQMADILRRTRPTDELSDLVKNNALILEGENANDAGMHDRQIKRLDILRGVSELILQLVPPERGVDNEKRLSKIKEVFVKQPEFSKLLVQYFETRFNPERPINDRGRAAGEIRLKKILNMLRTNLREATINEHFILGKSIDILIATVKTNYFVEERTNLFFRIDARAIVHLDESGALVNTPPSGLIWVHVPYGAWGAHSRYIDDARGGIRHLESDNIGLWDQVLVTCGALTVVQNDKHTGISEYGAKGAYGNKEGLNIVAATMGYMDALLTSMKEDDHDRIVIASDAKMIDPLYLGPDVGTGDFADIVTALAWIKGLERWQLVMTSKSSTLGGVSHKFNNLLNPPESGNNVTSLCAMEHVTEMVRYLIDIGKIILEKGRPATFKITGGPDGDVAGGFIARLIAHYGNNAAILAVGDISGVIFNPPGLSHESLLMMYKAGDAANKFPKDKLAKGGFVANAKPGAGEDSYITLDSDTLQYMNTMALDPDIIKKLDIEDQYRPLAGLKENEPIVVVLERDSNNHPSKVKVHTIYLREAMSCIVKSDMLLTGSTGKDLINQKNWPLFFDWYNAPASEGVVHGANVIIHNDASVEIEKRGVVIEPDKDANAGGVQTSSRVEIDVNSMFEIKEITRPLLASYLEQALKKFRYEHRRIFWRNRIEAQDHPDESVVTKVSPRTSTEIIELAARIARSKLVGDRESEYNPIVLEYLKDYFPDVSSVDKKYSTTLDRIFARMPVNRIRDSASRAIANDVVQNLGTGAVSELAKQTGVKAIVVVGQYLKVAREMKVNDKIREIIDNKEKLSPRQQIAGIKALREEMKSALKRSLLSANSNDNVSEELKSTQKRAVTKNVDEEIAAAIQLAGQADRGTAVSVNVAAVVAEILAQMPRELSENGIDVEGSLMPKLAELLYRQFWVEDGRTGLVFSKNATFGWHDKETQEVQPGLAIILPKLANAGLKIAIVALTDEQKAIVAELNKSVRDGNKICLVDGPEQAHSTLQLARYYYFTAAGEKPFTSNNTATQDITQFVKRIIDIIGDVCGITDSTEIDKLHSLALKIAQAA